MGIKDQLQEKAQARQWETKCRHLEHLGRLLQDFAGNPETTDAEALTEVTSAIHVVMTGQGELAPWIAAGLPRPASSLGWLREQEARLHLRRLREVKRSRGLMRRSR